MNNNFLITGVSSDIGQAIFNKLKINPNNRILLTSRRDISHSLDLKNENHKYISNIDLTSEDNLSYLHSVAENYFTDKFTIIHSVGDFWYHKSLVKTPFIEAKNLIESHFLSLFGLAHYLIPVLIKNGGGKIIAFSCNSVNYNYPDMSGFTPSKAAVESLIKCIANEYSKNNIIANAIALSTIRTPKVEASKNKKYHNDYINLDELVEVIVGTIENMSPLINGNIIKLLKHSNYFYNEGYYQRNHSER